MKRDAGTISGGSTLRFDVCVVGAGPVGIALAEKLATTGMRVVVLESGGEQPAALTQAFAQGRTSGMPYFRLDRARSRAFGGTSWQWADRSVGWPAAGGLRSRRLDELDLQARAHVPLSGWPLTLADLAPWYAAAEKRLGLSAPDTQPGDTPGWLSAYGPIRDASCQFAAPDVFSAPTTLADATNVTVLLHANVVEMALETGTNTVESVRVAAPGGSAFSVSARQFVLAMGGIDNARLLLTSKFGKPGGIANPRDQVGRYFMEHLHVESGGLRLAPGAPDLRASHSRALVEGRPRLTALQVSPEVQAREGLLNATVELRERSGLFLSPGVRSLAELAWAVGERRWPPSLARHVRNLALHPGAVLRAVKQKVARAGTDHGDATTLIVTAEQAPNPRSRVILDDKRDAFGVPLPRLHWAVTPLDTRSIRGTQDVLDAELRRLGFGSIEQKWGETSPTPYLHGCRHHIGTTRMSADANSGVVDADCRVHGLSNLYAAGSSVMPTAGAITVTLTAVALALRLAEHLCDLIREASLVGGARS